MRVAWPAAALVPAPVALDLNRLVGEMGAGRQSALEALYDATVGKVYGWTLSVYTARFAADLQTNTLGNGGTRVLRGGAWNSGPGAARASFRVRVVPDGRSNHFGFRVVCAPYLMALDAVALSADIEDPDLSSFTAPRIEAVAVTLPADLEDEDLWGALP